MPRHNATWRTLHAGLGDAGRNGLRASLGWTVSWWHVVRAGALILALALSPSTYDRATRAALARHVYLGSAPYIGWFALISALVSVVLIRVLVLELIPLGAALFVALRVTVPSGAALVRLRVKGRFAEMLHAGVDPLRHELMPRVLAGMFAVALLAAVSCLIAVLLSYGAVYGFTLGALPAFTRTLGQIFNPAVALIFAVKTLLFGLAIALIPVAAFLRAPQAAAARTSPELESLVRLFAAILLIEVLSLVGNYY